MRFLDKGYGFKILYPTIDFFLNEIDGGNYFNYIRFNHGIIDGFISYYDSPTELEADFNEGGVDLVLNNIRSNYPLWNYLYGIDLKNQLSTCLNLLFNLSHKNIIAGFDSNIGMGFGKGEFHYKHPKELKRIEFINYFVKYNNIDSYYTGLPKHWVIMGELPYLINSLEDRGFKLIFLGPEYVNHISNKLSSNIVNINIPLSKANETFDSTLDLIESESNGYKTIVFNSTGHILSSVLVDRFKDTNISTFDFGRGFDWLLLGEPDKVPHYDESWISYYKDNAESKFKKFINDVRNGLHLISMKSVNLEYTNISTHIPTLEYFLNKINSGETIKLLRINHGFIDGIYHAYNGRYSDFINDFKQKDYVKIAKNIVYSYYDKQWGFSHYHKNISFEVEHSSSNLMELLTNYDTLYDKLDIAISLGVGLNEFWGVWDKDYPLQIGRGKVADVITTNTENKFLYSGMFKYFTIMGELPKIFELLNKNNYNVVFLGPEKFGGYIDMFNVENGNFIQIPSRGAIKNIGEFIDDVRRIDSTNSNKTMVFLQCGHIISASIIKEFLNTDISILDIGRSFDILMKDEFIGKGQDVEDWTGVDKELLIRHVKNIQNSF